MNNFLTDLLSFLQQPIELGDVLSLPISILDVVLRFFLPFFASLLVIRLLRRSIRKGIENSRFQEETKTRLQRMTLVVSRILILVITLLLLIFLLSDQFFQVFSTIGDILNQPFISSGDLQISVLTLLAAIPVFYLANWAGKTSRVVIEKEVLRRIPVDASQRFSIANILRYAIMLLVIIIGLSIIGINFSSLIVVFSVLGIGIGFGLQGLVANFFAGMIIIITRPIKEGDFVITQSTADTVEGHVVRITLLHSVITTLLNETVIVPNSSIISAPVHNYSYDDPQISVLMSVDVHYDSDLDQVEQLLLELGKDSPHWNQEREPRVLVKEFAASGITMQLILRITDGSERFLALSWLRKETWRRFRDAGVVIPYPQLDLYIKEGGSTLDT